ncbi:unnamed protein product [Lactuca virosa]|uniref:Uncharacterized protein n=1 Tax=Lactuca virosa TaxID=75947 RepID=A0AAU9NRY4_9ASTR|nr:unnamed protein product [Lactuca virosa]
MHFPLFIHNFSVTASCIDFQKNTFYSSLLLCHSTIRTASCFFLYLDKNQSFKEASSSIGIEIGFVVGIRSPLSNIQYQHPRRSISISRIGGTSSGEHYLGKSTNIELQPRMLCFVNRFCNQLPAPN